ncbi:Pkinase-domain-containing protein [Auriscalpium vulgare]|uniref:Pkinase-domain-containing protein n=1 Tax=Auriscalpium vulgare TaxID=40419 RepID=A0ACB8RG46_9AGAM|nr:Pkinase-domain-containing protein [Auriscalpium vulgare]
MAPSIAPPAQKTSSGASFGQRPDDQELRPYVLTGDLGAGSFATVYKGYNEETRQEVAVKTVSRSTLSTKLFENLQSEIDILKSLSHRHITRLIDIIRAERNIYLIMEYCSGGDLTHYIKKRGRVDNLEYIPEPGAAPQYYPHPRTGGLAEIVVRSFLRQLARALKFLRQRNLIHRDIKPQNLLLKPATEEDLGRGHPLGVPLLKVADFGFARSLPNAMMAETLCGSPLYMAPEILSYQKYDAKADLWSVGAVLYEMSVGRPPFRAMNHIDLLKKIEHSKGIKFPDEDPAASPDTVSVPADIKKLIRSLLRRNPAERASFEDFFKSTAMVNSKFPRPAPPVPEQTPQQPAEGDSVGPQDIPRHLIQVPPEVLDPQAMIPPSKFNFRKHEGSPSSQSEVPMSASPRSPMPDIRPTPVRVPSSTGKPPSDPRPVLRPLSTEGSVIPGETEEDGLLRREYVLVGDTRAVEFNRAVDEINAARRRPLQDRRVPLTPLSLEKERSEFASPESPQAASPNATFPPHPNPQSISPPAMPHRSASNALSRALTLASKKLFGVTGVSPHSYESSPLSSSPRRAQIMAARREREEEEGRGRDPVEDDLLAALEQLAQKTHVITRWADEMYEYVKAVPQKPLPDPSKFTPREGEPEKLAMRRRNADMQAEYNAVTCVAIYMLVMSFSQKGIDELRKYQEHMEMRHPDEDFVVSEGFDDALMWFKEHFLKCNDRTALVKTWLPAQYTGPSTWVDELVYNRALTLSRTAARKELLNQHKSPDECERLYEESLWCLYALQDDLLQRGNPFMEEDRDTISTWIKRTKLRLVRCRARMSMNQRDRLRDARADQNLHDVTVLAPWDAETPGQFHDKEGGLASPMSS